MNTTVITVEEHDFGTGKADRRVEFRDCRWTVDERGCLHIYKPGQSHGSVTVAAFSPGAWTAATNGSIHGAGVSVVGVAGERA